MKNFEPPEIAVVLFLDKDIVLTTSALGRGYENNTNNATWGQFQLPSL